MSIRGFDALATMSPTAALALRFEPIELRPVNYDALEPPVADLIILA